MKKILSLILILSLICTLGLTPAVAAGTFNVLYTLPTNMHNTQVPNNHIAINQGEVKIVFTEAVDADSLSGITFKDSKGNAPKGGIFVSLDDTKTVATVKFGELNMPVTNAEQPELSFDGVYTLTIPDSVSNEAKTETLSSVVSRTFTTIAKKALVDVDFSNPVFSTGAVTVANNKLFSTVYDASIVKDLYLLKGGSSLSITDAGTLKIQKTATNDTHVGGHYRSSNRLPNAKVVTVLKYAEPTLPSNLSGMGIGALRTGSFASAGPVYNTDGMAYSVLKDAEFFKENGYYDVTVVSNVKETSVSGNNITYNDWYKAYDNLSNKTVSSTVGTKTFAKNASASVYTNSVSIIKIYRSGTTFEIKSAKQGFFTIPEPLNEAAKAGRTLTYVVNTDIDVSKSTAAIGDIPAILSYDAQTRKLTLTYTGNLVEGTEYDISFKNIVSADGIKGDVVAKYTATESDTPEVVYSVSSSAYTVDNENLKITGVAPGTTKAELLTKVLISGDYAIKDASGNEISEETSFIKDGATIELGNGTIYTIELDFENNPDLITDEKYEFIIDGNASEDADNVYSSASAIKVTFDSEDFTSVDDSSFNNVSIYETANPTNTVAISDTVYDANVLTLTIGGTLEAGKNYTLKLSDVKDTVFAKAYTFTKTFNVIAPVTTFNVSYTIPNILTTIKNIGVNQEEIKVYFEEEIASGYENITFKDSLDASPIGGIKVSASGKVVTVKFGELKELETYTLSIPATLLSTSGKNAVARDIEFVTLKKDLTNVDFSDSQTWTDGTYTKAELSEKGLPTSFTASKTTMTVENGALNVAMSAANDVYLGSTYSDLTTAKVVSFIKSGVPTTTTGNPINNTRLGGVFNGSFNDKFPAHIGGSSSHFNEGASYGSDIYIRDFVRDNGYYDLTVISKLTEKSVSDDLTKKTVGTSWEVFDNLSAFSRSSSIADREYTIGTVVRTKATAAFKFYHANTLNIKSIRQGFYTVPSYLEKTAWDNETNKFTYIMNTNIDVSKSTVSGIGIVENGITFDASTRTLTVETVEPVEGTPYSVTLNAVSADGLKFKDTLTVLSGEIDPTYTITSSVYTVNGETLEITGAAHGTTKAQLMANLEITGATPVVKDANGADIGENDVLKDEATITLSDEYTTSTYVVKLDFENNPLITEDKYRFIINGSASEDAQNVYDSASGIKVSFNVEAFTAIDGSSFNNVSIYETSNAGNTVAISNGSFADNTYSFDIGALTAGTNYTLKLQGVKDTFFGKEYTFTKEFTVVATPVPTYTIESTEYTVDDVAFKVTGVVPGTTKEEFLSKVLISGDYVIEDASGNEIGESEVLKANATIELGNGDIYTIVLDFENNPLITENKYEFIVDGNAFEDAQNVYSSTSGIKVKFNVAECTAIDGSSFNNVSIYETSNPENTVAIANGSFNDNTYSFDVTGLTVGKNYTLKLLNVRDTIFGKEHTFEKALTVVAPVTTFEALYTIPNILPTVSNKIGVNQEEIKVYFEEALASGIENITFTDSLGNAPIGGITVSADGKAVTVKFGELKEEETYTLSIPSTLVSTEGSISIAKNFEFVTLKKTLTDADFSDSLTWADGTYTAAQINEKGKVTAWFKANNGKIATATVADDLLKITLPSSTDTYLGVNAGWMTTAKLVSFVKYKVDFKNENTSGFTLGGMWSGQFNTNVPKTGSNGNFAVAGNGVPYSTIDSNGFVKEDGTDLYDVTVTSTYKEKEVSADMAKKTMDASVVVRDNNSDKVINQADTNTMTYNFNETIAKVSHFSVLKTYFRNDVSFAKIKQGFYTAPAPLGLPTWNGEAKTITYVMNTDIDVAKSSVTVGELPATLAFDALTRKLTVTYTGDIVEGEDYNVSFGNVISVDGLRGEGEAKFNTVLLTVVSANPMNGSKIKAQAGTMTFVFSQDVTKEALEANATFMRKETEATVPVTFTVADDNRTATMAYPTLLNSTEYVLKMPKTFIFGGLEYSYMTTGSNTIKSLTPSFNLADSNEINPYLGLIKVEFNDPVTLDMAKQYITLKQGTTDVSINITEDNGVFSIWLPVLEAQKTYTFMISDILLEEKCEITLDVQAPTQTITTAPASGKTIDVNEREITITFENEYTLSQLENAISFVDDNGNGPKGGVYIRKDETNPKKAILRFGRLEANTFYHVVINSLPNADNIMFNYTTGGTYALEVTFDDWETGKIETPATGATYAMGGLILGHASGKLAESEFEIKENSDGTKYLQVKATKKSKNIAVGYKFPTSMESGKFIAEMGVRSGSTSAEGFKSSANSVLTHATSGSPGGGTALDANAISSFSAFTTNANGFYELTAELTKTTTETSITYTGKNDASVSWGPKSFVSAINSVAFLKMYSNQSADDTLNLDYVKAYFVKDLDVVNLLNGFDPMNKQIEIVFSEDVDAESLKALKLTSASHNVDLEFVSYYERKAIFNLSEHLNYGTDYEISFKDVKGTSGFVMMTETPIKFKTMEYAIKGSDEAVTNGVLTLTLKNSLNENRNYKVSIVLYDSSDRVIKAKTVEGTALTGDTPVTVSTGVSEYADYKTFIWDITNGYYVPVK